ncbi:serine hydrolase [Micromonospora sp. 15K316]|uniref:serine hydrolase domain-containing protein n=1 Tax=Micromonospora sp. 15K316 TaxID=2530376 RepID=UPI0014043C65|nr:serine hydrolase domain-containing protein [Micromonospora sp. 15K316]
MSRPRWLATLLAVVATGLVVAAPAAAAPTDENIPTSDAIAGVEEYLRKQQDEHRIPGLAYAIVGRDRVIGQAAWGIDGQGAAVTGQTPFLIGSVSKPFTALAVMRLVEAGRVNLDDPVRRHLPWFRLADDDAAGRITVRQLLTHTSGLPRWASRTDRFDNTAGGLARSVRDLATVEPVESPGAAHRYSDANYMVLGALVETVTGQPFGGFLRREVFDPLDMRHAAGSEAEAERVGLSAGHRYWFGHPRRFDPGYDTSGVPYGYVAASLDDLTHFVTAQLDGGRYAGTQVLSADGITQMHTGQVDTSNSGRYGLGWRDTELEGTDTRVVWHAGATPGYFAHLVLIPGSGLGVIVLANSYSLALDSSLATMGFNIARMAHGETWLSSGADPLLSAALYTLLAVVGLLTITVAWSLVRAVRPRRRAQTERVRITAVAAWVFGCVALICVVVAALPAMLGGDLGQALLWTPDIGWTIITIATLASAVAIVRIGVAVRAILAIRR